MTTRTTGRARAPDEAGRAGQPAAGRAAAGERAASVRYRRRRWVALAIVVLVVAAGLAAAVRYVLVSSSVFAVQHVEVAGAAVVPPAAVLGAAGVTTGTPLISVPVADVAARVAAVSGVSSVEVSRDWPDTLRLQVTERVAVALTATSQGPWLVDATGLAYAPAASIPTPAPPALPLPMLAIAQVTPQDTATKAALAVLAALPDPVRRDLQKIEADTPSMVVLRLTGNRQVRWGPAGSPEELGRKAAVLVPLLSQRGSVYDVTSPDLPTIRR
ncbi:MAG: hypothetical protein JWR88_1139 [Pseudonocardia sp.]|nr:hypothetical protein [Pseudonocardia sp.]